MAAGHEPVPGRESGPSVPSLSNSGGGTTRRPPWNHHEPTAINSCSPVCTHIHTHVFLQEGRVEDRASDWRPVAFAWICSRNCSRYEPLIHPFTQAANTHWESADARHCTMLALPITRPGREQSQHNPYPLWLPSYLKRESHPPCDFSKSQLK